MPTVAVLQGVRVEFYPNDHRPPHFHAVIAEYRATIDMRTMTIVGGSLPRGKSAMLLRWASAHRTELQEAWAMMRAGRKPGRIG